MEAIKGFEGFTAKAKWDYAQSSNGYGTRARYDGEVIDRAEAERRFRSEISQAFEIVQRFAPNLDDGTKAALTSLTYNAGPTWTRSGLGKAIQAGDMTTARELFQKYNRAGGSELAGLTNRRMAEVAWFNSATTAPLQSTAQAEPAANITASITNAAPISWAVRNVLHAPGAIHDVENASIDPSSSRLSLTLDSVLVLLSLLTGSSDEISKADGSKAEQRQPERMPPEIG